MGLLTTFAFSIWSAPEADNVGHVDIVDLVLSALEHEAEVAHAIAAAGCWGGPGDALLRAGAGLGESLTATVASIGEAPGDHDRAYLQGMRHVSSATLALIRMLGCDDLIALTEEALDGVHQQVGVRGVPVEADSGSINLMFYGLTVQACLGMATSSFLGEADSMDAALRLYMEALLAASAASVASASAA